MALCMAWQGARRNESSVDNAVIGYREQVRDARLSTVRCQKETLEYFLSEIRTLIDQGQPEEALLALDPLTEEFCESEDPDAAARAVEAQVSAALLADRISGIQDAVDRLEKIIAQRDTQTSDDSMRYSICYAMRRLYEFLTAQGPDQVPTMLASIETIDKMVAEFGDDESIGIVTMVAEALTNQVELLIRFSQWDEARRTLEQITKRYGNRDDARLRDLARIARIRKALLDSISILDIVLDPDGLTEGKVDPSAQKLIVRMPWLAADRACLRAWHTWAKERIAAGDVDVPAPEPEDTDGFETFSTLKKVEAGFKRRLDRTDSICERATEAHQEAVEILDRYRAWGLPFALYLRSFDASEWYRVLPRDHAGSRWAHPPFNPPFRTFYCMHKEGEGTPLIDAEIIVGLREKVPVIFATNTYGGSLDRLSGPSLLLPDAVWQAPVRALISQAELIVIRAMLASTSILEELAQVREMGREQDTIVVLPEESEVHSMLSMQRASSRQYGIEFPEYELFTPEHAALTGIQLCRDRELRAGNTDIFLAPITKFYEINQMDPVARVERCAERLRF
jgi:hypothetical protein